MNAASCVSIKAKIHLRRTSQNQSKCMHERQFATMSFLLSKQAIAQPASKHVNYLFGKRYEINKNILNYDKVKLIGLYFL